MKVVHFSQYSYLTATLVLLCNSLSLVFLVHYPTRDLRRRLGLLANG